MAMPLIEHLIPNPPMTAIDDWVVPLISTQLFLINMGSGVSHAVVVNIADMYPSRLAGLPSRPWKAICKRFPGLNQD